MQNEYDSISLIEDDWRISNLRLERPSPPRAHISSTQLSKGYLHHK